MGGEKLLRNSYGARQWLRLLLLKNRKVCWGDRSSGNFLFSVIRGRFPACKPVMPSSCSVSFGGETFLPGYLGPNFDLTFSPPAFGGTQACYAQNYLQFQLPTSLTIYPRYQKTHRHLEEEREAGYLVLTSPDGGDELIRAIDSLRSRTLPDLPSQESSATSA